MQLALYKKSYQNLHHFPLSCRARAEGIAQLVKWFFRDKEFYFLLRYLYIIFYAYLFFFFRYFLENNSRKKSVINASSATFGVDSGSVIKKNKTLERDYGPLGEECGFSRWLKTECLCWTMCCANQNSITVKRRWQRRMNRRNGSNQIHSPRNFQFLTGRLNKSWTASKR